MCWCIHIFCPCNLTYCYSISECCWNDQVFLLFDNAVHCIFCYSNYLCSVSHIIIEAIAHRNTPRVFQFWVVFSGLGVEMWSCCRATDHLLWNLACIQLHPWNRFCKSCASKNGWNELLSQECWFAQHSDILPRKASFVFKGRRLTQIRICSKPSDTSCQWLNKHLPHENTTHLEVKIKQCKVAALSKGWI